MNMYLVNFVVCFESLNEKKIAGEFALSSERSLMMFTYFNLLSLA